MYIYFLVTMPNIVEVSVSVEILWLWRRLSETSVPGRHS
jgi:hypothetical protein